MNSQKILIKTAEWYSTAESKTYGDLAQYIASVLSSKIGPCEYKVINNYPVIKLPCVDENLSTDTFPAMWFSGTATSSAGGNTTLYIGISNGASDRIGNDSSYWFMTSNSSSCNNAHGSTNFANNNLCIQINADYLEQYEIYSIGWHAVSKDWSEDYVQQGVYFGTPVIIGKLTSVTDEFEVNACIYVNFYSSKYVNIKLISNVISEKSVMHSYGQDTGIVIADDLTNGRYYHKHLKIVNPADHTILQDIVNYSKQGRAATFGWKKSAIIIDGQSYDILISNSSSASLIIPTVESE